MDSSKIQRNYSIFSKSKYVMEFSNKLGQPDQYGATPIASVSFIPKLTSNIRNFGEKKLRKNFKVPTFSKNLTWVTSDLRLFVVSFSQKKKYVIKFIKNSIFFPILLSINLFFLLFSDFSG